MVTAVDVARKCLSRNASAVRSSPVSVVGRRGFETAIKATTGEQYLAVRAVDEADRVLATSAVIRQLCSGCRRR